MQLEIPDEDGGTFAFECDDTLPSAWVCTTILRDQTYPAFGFLEDVRVVVDAGANCGAASVHFARHHPEATVHAFEPARATRAILERNAARWPSILVHPFGLFDRDDEVPLFHGDDSILASIHQREVNRHESEPISLRAAGAWAAEQGIDRIDVLKVDVEGCETEVLTSLAPLLPTVKVLYVEYDSRRARRDVDRLLEPTHELWFARLLALDQGECIYVHADLVDHDDVRERLVGLFREAMEASGAAAPTG